MTAGREAAIDLEHAALLIIDVQNYCAHRAGGWSRQHEPTPYLLASLHHTVVPNIKRLQAICRRTRVEILYSVIENMTNDGRDRSLDYRISGIDVARASWDAQVLDEIAPAEDEMIFRKTSSNVFVSTNIDYVLRNLGLRSLIVAGIMSRECGARCLRPRLSRHPCHRWLYDRHRRAPSAVADRARRLLPPAFGRRRLAEIAALIAGRRHAEIATLRWQ